MIKIQKRFNNSGTDKIAKIKDHKHYKYLGIYFDGPLTFKENLNYFEEKTQKRAKNIVYLNHEEVNPDLIIKAFHTYTFTIYAFHAPIMVLKEKKFKLLEKRMILDLKRVLVSKQINGATIY